MFRNSYHLQAKTIWSVVIMVVTITIFIVVTITIPLLSIVTRVVTRYYSYLGYYSSNYQVSFAVCGSSH